MTEGEPFSKEVGINLRREVDLDTKRVRNPEG